MAAPTSKRLRRLFQMAMLAAALVLAAAPAGAEPVRVSAARGADYGRIVFDWRAPVGYRSERSGNRLTVHFSRPIEATLSAIPRRLSKYLAGAEAGADGQSVVLELKSDFDAYAYDAGSNVIVEIADKPGAADAAPEPEKAPDKAADKAPDKAAEKAPAETAASAPGKDLPKIGVRAGRHPDYTRIVFDWPDKVAYSVDQKGGVASVTFEKAANMDLARLQTRRPPFIGGARARLGADSVTVDLAVPASSTVRHFLSGNKVVVDVRRPEGGDKAGPLPPETAKAGPKTEPKAETKTATAEAAPAPTQPKPAAQPKPAPQARAAATPATPDLPPTKTAPVTPVTRTAASPAPIPNQSPAQSPARAGGPAAGTAETAATQATRQAAAAQAETRTQTQAAPATTAPRALTPTPLTPPGRLPAAQAQTKATAPLPGDAATAPATATATGTATGTALPPPAPTPRQVTAETPPGDAVTLRFDWDEPVGAAVFRRAGYLWVAFDKPTAIDVDQLRQAGGNIVKGIEQLGTAKGTVLRLATISGINPNLRRDGMAWLLDFRKQPLEPQTPLPVKAQPESPVGARLFVPVTEPGDPIAITDPEVGDSLVIVPLLPLANGMELEYMYPQVRFLKSAQGVVVQPQSDDIRVRPLRQGIEITSATTLYMSVVTAEAEANRKLAAQKPLTRILNLDRWKLKSMAEFLPRKHELLTAVASNRDTGREAARLNLARFYFSNGLHAEALALLDLVAQERPEVEAEPEFRMLRGGARLMIGRLAEAAEDFNQPSVNQNDEAIFWLSAARAMAGDVEGAAPELKRTDRIVRPYPEPLRTPLGTLVVKTAIDVGDVKEARHILEITRLGKLVPSERSILDLQEGRILELTGDFDGAVAKWEKVRDDGYDRPSAIRAVVDRTELLLKLGRVTRKEAIQNLERVRFAWRGDGFEFRLLRRLGTLYLEDGRYREGLESLRQAATYYRTNPEAPEVTQQMADAFSDLYLNNAADKLPPLVAIALYDEFKELTPAGSRGDELIRKLADRLVGVDLLDRAIQLLGAQVKFRLQGVEKARVGTQLALVQMLARKDPAALQTLDETETPGIPPALADLRRHLRAKAVMNEGRREDALAVLRGDRTVDGELLRTEIFWTARDWVNAARSLQRMIRASGVRPGDKLDEAQAAHILNEAITLELSGNERGLARVRSDYGAAMDETSLKDAFALITRPPEEGLLNPADVALRVKEAENFKTFMSAYRERLKKQDLSQLVPAALVPHIAGAGAVDDGVGGANKGASAQPAAAPAVAPARPPSVIPQAGAAPRPTAPRPTPTSSRTPNAPPPA